VPCTSRSTRQSRFAQLTRINVRNLAGVPSIVYGLLGLAIFVQAMGGITGGRTVLAGGLALSALVLPIVIITASEALRAVPRSIREGALGVGATQWETVRSHVLPSAARASSPAPCCRWPERRRGGPDPPRRCGHRPPADRQPELLIDQLRGRSRPCR
jgi:ABC-type proline/glycine betaine transport system permease subunit